MEDNNNDGISGDEDAGVDHLVDVDLELLLELVEVLLLSLATTHPAGWGGFEARSLEKLWKILPYM